MSQDVFNVFEKKETPHSSSTLFMPLARERGKSMNSELNTRL